MLNATAQKLGDSTVLRCQGRIVIGDAYAILRNAVLRQTHTRTLILDLAQVDRIDAGGLGVLLGLREWACSHAIRFQLMNVTNQVEHVLELTKLDRVLEFCSVEDMLQLLHFAAAIAPRSVDRANQRIMKDCKYSSKGKMLLQPHRETVFLLEPQLARKSGREFQPTCSRQKLAHGLVMRGQLLARNTTVIARALVGTDRCPTDRYLELTVLNSPVPA
jgi:anti-anti-sigma factor